MNTGTRRCHRPHGEHHLAPAARGVPPGAHLRVELGRRWWWFGRELIINDVTIGNRSQFAQSGALPGDMFANNSIDSFVTFETAQTAMDVTMIVTYIGLDVHRDAVLRLHHRHGGAVSHVARGI